MRVAVVANPTPTTNVVVAVIPKLSPLKLTPPVVVVVQPDTQKSVVVVNGKFPEKVIATLSGLALEALSKPDPVILTPDAPKSARWPLGSEGKTFEAELTKTLESGGLTPASTIMWEPMVTVVVATLLKPSNTLRV